MTKADLEALRLAFATHAGWYRNDLGRSCCWLWQFDDLRRPCGGCLEAVHLIGRQRVRNRLWGVDRDVVVQAEWDPRNAALGCTEHHRRFDSHATPRLWVPVDALRRDALEYFADFGLETDAEAKFSGSLILAEALPKVSSRAAIFPSIPELQPRHISALAAMRR